MTKQFILITLERRQRMDDDGDFITLCQPYLGSLIAQAVQCNKQFQSQNQQHTAIESWV